MKLWVSSPKFTGQVDATPDGVIYKAPNIWRVFEGQRVDRLIKWLHKFGSVEVETLGS